MKNKILTDNSLFFNRKDQINLGGIFQRLVVGSICFLTVYYMLHYAWCFPAEWSLINVLLRSAISYKSQNVCLNTLISFLIAWLGEYNYVKNNFIQKKDHNEDYDMIVNVSLPKSRSSTENHTFNLKKILFDWIWFNYLF